MNITIDKVNNFFRDLGFDLPSNPEMALETSIEAIRNNPNMKGKVTRLVEEFRKKLNTPGMNWDILKGWMASFLSSKNPKPIGVEAVSEPDPNKSKFMPLVLEKDIISKVFYDLCLNIKKNNEEYKKLKDMLGKSTAEYDSIPYRNKKLSSFLDSLADRLESKGHLKEAYEIDKIADVLDTL